MRPSSFENVTELGVPFEVISDVIFLAIFFKKNCCWESESRRWKLSSVLGRSGRFTFLAWCIAGELKNHLILDCFNQMQPFFFLCACKSDSSLWKENSTVRRKLWDLHRWWPHFLYTYVCSSNKGKCPQIWICPSVEKLWW